MENQKDFDVKKLNESYKELEEKIKHVEDKISYNCKEFERIDSLHRLKLGVLLKVKEKNKFL